MEMGSLAADGQAGDDDAAVALSPEKDIMQLARIGDIVAMEKLFESGEFDATYSDDEGITPLHVSTSLPTMSLSNWRTKSGRCKT